MVKLTCKFPTIYNVSLIVLKLYLGLLDFNWYRAITQCTRRPTVNVLTTKLGIKNSRYSYAEERGILTIVAKRLNETRCHLAKR